MELVELEDEDSWLTFNILELEEKWLNYETGNWCTSEKNGAMYKRLRVLSKSDE